MPTTTDQNDGGGHGEILHGYERLLVSPTTGLFVPAWWLTPGARVEAGEHVLAHVGDVPVRSPFTGCFIAFLAVPGRRVRCHQPLGWLRV